MEIKSKNRKIIVGKSTIAIAALTAAFACGLAGFYITNVNKGIIIDTANTEDKKYIEGTAAVSTTLANPVEDKGTENTYKKDEIQVYVVGCVKNQGLVTLRKGQLISDAIDAAGGPTEDADIYNINLAYKLNENVMIRIRSKYETQQAGAYSLAPAQDGGGLQIIYDSNGAVVGEASGETSGTAGSLKKININTAGVEQLDTLPGIGVETAKDIIAYREKNGYFKCIEDIMKVAGIKESRFSRIKDYITVE